MTSAGATSSPTYTPYLKNTGSPLAVSMSSIQSTPLVNLPMPCVRIRTPSIRRRISLPVFSFIGRSPWISRDASVQAYTSAPVGRPAGEEREQQADQDDVREHAVDEPRQDEWRGRRPRQRHDQVSHR